MSKSNQLVKNFQLKINYLNKFFKNIAHHKIGKCNICGKYTLFISLYPKSPREDCYCIFCISNSRKRHLAKIINEKYTKTKHISQIPQKNINLKIYSTDVNDSFFRVLYKKYVYFYCSFFSNDYKLGEQLDDRIYCQNLESLTFKDSYFDIVITEDVFEHIRDYKKAFREVFRILREGGVHIFTIPFYFDKYTYVRVDVVGEYDILIDPEYHGDYLAYRTFGKDLFDFLESLGFKTTVFFSENSDKKYCIKDSYVFVSKK